ncbi:calcium/calmodulin dependent protein kinase [Aspergillus arachidicola]|uniref:Calcium/calmodulin dependent protein kinase n=1 Tax=Aspergillus arachidicola TaxID=656916 RepID=A0A2G7FYP1_9EURO|nr:calcium/calmodulin dependent protein kinase [Aspergillus arachidicola]
MASSSNLSVGPTGSRYQFKQLIQERPHVGQDQFILKDTPKDIFSNFNEKIRSQLVESPYIRLPWDNIPDERILVYRYLTDDFLNLVREGIPIHIRKQLLKASLRGIAELHDRQIVHLDIKPDNIMVDRCNAQDETIIEHVQIIDLENAVHLPKGRCIKGMLAGNDNWRSPEANFKDELNKLTDMFSIAIVVMYLCNSWCVIFGPDDDFRKHEAQGVLPALIRLQRQVSYFGDQEKLSELVKHISDDGISCQGLQMLWEEIQEDHIPYRLFSEWQDVSDPVFKDFILGLTSLDPHKRLMARQALDHPWLANF